MAWCLGTGRLNGWLFWSRGALTGTYKSILSFGLLMRPPGQESLHLEPKKIYLSTIIGGFFFVDKKTDASWKLNDWPKCTYQVSGKARIQTQI